MYITSLTTHCHHKSSCLNTTTSTMAGIIAPIAVCLALISFAAAFSPLRCSKGCSSATVEGSQLDSRNCSNGGHYPNSAEWRFTFTHDLSCPGLPYVNVQYDIAIENAYNCIFDSLILGYNTADPVKLCGNRTGQLSVPNASAAYQVLFHSDRSVTGRGFKLNVTFTCSPEFDSPYNEPDNTTNWYTDYETNYPYWYNTTWGYPNYTAHSDYWFNHTYRPTYPSWVYTNYTTPYYNWLNHTYRPTNQPWVYTNYNTPYYNWLNHTYRPTNQPWVYTNYNTPYYNWLNHTYRPGH